MAGSLLYSNAVKKSTNWKPTRSKLRDPSGLAKSLGLTYDADTLQAKFNDATKAEYEGLRNEYANTENDYYRNMYNTQQDSIDTIRKNNAAAVATGASRGMQAANELSSVLGLQQTSAEGATQLANDRNLLMDKEQAAYKQNAMDAINKSNELGLQLGTLNSNLYATDTQYDVGLMDYYAQLDQAMKALMGTQEQANATMYNADKNLEGNKYTADKNYAGTKYTADKNYAASARYSSGGGGGYTGYTGYTGSTGSGGDNAVGSKDPKKNYTAMDYLVGINNPLFKYREGLPSPFKNVGTSIEKPSAGNAPKTKAQSQWPNSIKRR